MSVPIFEDSPENFRCMAIKIARALEELSFLCFVLIIHGKLIE